MNRNNSSLKEVELLVHEDSSFCFLPFFVEQVKWEWPGYSSSSFLWPSELQKEGNSNEGTSLVPRMREKGNF